MHLDPRLLFLVVPLGFTLGASLGHGVQEVYEETFIDPHNGQEPIPYGSPLSNKWAVEKEHTIYKTLSGDPEFSRITKALNFVEDVASLLDDPSAELTFFAPPDKALRHPEHPHGPGHPHFPNGPRRVLPPHPLPHESPAGFPNDHSSTPSRDLSSGYLSSLKRSLLRNEAPNSLEISDFGSLVAALDILDDFQAAFADYDDDDKEKCKKIFKIILRAILHYHIIPVKAYELVDLARNTTYPTKLAIPGALDGKPLRLRVSQSVLPPLTSINFFTRIRRPDVKASNGIIHVVDHPLIPPPSVFQELYLAPHFFSTLTSVLQRSGLTKEVDLRYVRGEGLSGASLVTIFAPTNRAFDALPLHLRVFLFSPFGENVLRKLLQFHIVPNTIVHSNYIHHTKKAEEPASQLMLNEMDDSWEHRPGPLCQYLHPEHSDLKSKVLGWLTRVKFGRRAAHHHEKPKIKPIISTNLTLDTLLVNHTLHAFISQKEIEVPFPGRKHSIIDTRVLVNGHPVIVPDAVGLNGVIHVVDRLLDPRGQHHPGHPHHHHHHHHHHKHHHKHGPHHPSDRHPHEGDRSQHFNNHSYDTWEDWESWLVQWADEQA